MNVLIDGLLELFCNSNDHSGLKFRAGSVRCRKVHRSKSFTGFYLSCFSIFDLTD